MPVDHALDALLEGGGAEVDRQTDAEVEEAEVGQELLEVNSGQVLDGLQLHDHGALDQKVHSETVVEVQSLVLERDLRMPLHSKAAPFERSRKDRQVHRLEEPRTQSAVQVLRRVDHRGHQFPDITRRRAAERSGAILSFDHAPLLAQNVPPDIPFASSCLRVIRR